MVAAGEGRGAAAEPVVGAGSDVEVDVARTPGPEAPGCVEGRIVVCIVPAWIAWAKAG